MAESEFGHSQILKNTKIVVDVEEALEDLLVVSFTCGAASFQGVLLNSTKKNWPCGVMPPASAFPGSGESQVVAEQATLDNDKLFAVSRRYTYFQETDNRSKYALIPRRTNCRRPGDKNARTMRLRPRQVLCSKCKSICNENSENVEVANTSREASRALEKRTDPAGSQVTVQPKSSIAPPNNGGASAVLVGGNAPTSTAIGGITPVCAADNNTQDGLCLDRMVLRRRRVAEELPVTSEEAGCAAKRPKESEPENLCSATVEEKLPASAEEKPIVLTEEKKAPAPMEEKNPLTKTSPFIKISFGPLGTVLKIPPRSNNYSASDTDAELQETAATMPETIISATKDASAKAAKKALKKAKKEAHRKSVVLPSVPTDPLEPHKTRHHKHKFKHKRRHKDGPCSNTADNNNCDIVADFNGMPLLDAGQDGKPADLENENLLLESWDCGDCDGGPHNHADAYNEIKKECLRQKLSISLKRLSEKSYTKCGAGAFNEDSNGSGGDSSPSDSNSNSNSEAGDVPEFPESEPPKDFEKVRPLMMRISSHAAMSCSLGDGRNMAVGDIVWGKIHGFPWWPGKVLSIMVSQRDNGMLITQQAHVAWFGSSTSSYMPCSQLVPFLECFKIRYNKKKRGPYKEAIKQATLAAQQVLRNVAVDVET